MVYSIHGYIRKCAQQIIIAEYKGYSITYALIGSYIYQYFKDPLDKFFDMFEKFKNFLRR